MCARAAPGASGRILVSLPEEIYGHEAVAQNRRSAIARDTRRELQRAWNRILADLFAKLAEGRLVAYGSLDSSLNPKELIKATAWDHLELSGLRGSTLREKRKEGRRLVYSVRIFPTVEADCAADLLAGQSMVSCIKQHVLNDPQAASLMERIGDEGALSAQFLRRVLLGASKSSFQPFERISAHSKIRHRQIRCAEILRRRLHFLRALLESGGLIVQGVSPQTTALSTLPSDFWSQPHVYINLESGDLHYSPKCEDEPLLIMRQPNFRQAGAHLVLPSAPFPPATKKVERQPSAKAPAALECRNWLILDMRASLETKPRPKAAYFEEALARWGSRLSKDAFDRAWAEALDETGAKWGKAGRPPKSSGRKSGGQ